MNSAYLHRDDLKAFGDWLESQGGVILTPNLPEGEVFRGKTPDGILIHLFRSQFYSAYGASAEIVRAFYPEEEEQC